MQRMRRRKCGDSGCEEMENFGNIFLVSLETPSPQDEGFLDRYRRRDTRGMP